MTLTNYLPRIGLLERPVRKHRSPDEVRRLRGLLDRAHALIKGLQMQLADKDEALTETAAKQGVAEELVVQQQADLDELTAERDELLAEVLKFRARFGPQMAAEANANRVTVPPMVRPIDSPEEEATAPIDVRPLWDALGVGPTTAVTDPGHFPTP